MNHAPLDICIVLQQTSRPRPKASKNWTRLFLSTKQKMICSYRRIACDVVLEKLQKQPCFRKQEGGEDTHSRKLKRRRAVNSKKSSGDKVTRAEN